MIISMIMMMITTKMEMFTIMINDDGCNDSFIL